MAMFAAARRSRGALLITAAVPPAILAAHVIFYGAPAWLWRYIRVAMEMSAGYGVAMSEGGDTRGLILAILLMAAWAAATAVLYRRGIASWPFAFACLGPLFLEFKHSFAREAGHIEIFFLFVPLLAGLVALYTRIGRRDLWHVTAAVGVLAALWLVREFPRLRDMTHPLAPLANLRALQYVARPPAPPPNLEPDRLPPNCSRA